MPMPLTSHLTSKRSSKAGRAKMRVKHNLLLIFGWPLSIRNFHSSCTGQGSHDRTKVFNELSIKRCQVMEAHHFCGRGRHRPTLDGFNFGLTHLYALSQNKRARKDNLW